MTLDSVTSHVHLVTEVATEKLFQTRSPCVQGLFVVKELRINMRYY